MRLLVLYFSGTGNTEYVARYLVAKVAAGAVLPVRVEPQLVPVETTAPERIPDHDLLALGFPVYECDSPRFFRKGILHLPPGEGRGAFVFCTKEAVAGNALRLNLLRLQRKGYVPCGYACVGMPGTDGLPLMGKASWPVRAALRRNYDNLPSADALAGAITRVAYGLRSGKTAACFQVRLPVSVPGFLLNPLLALIYRAVEGIIRRSFRADERCDGCGFCARICPSGSIALRNGRVTFLDGCYLCLRCVHNCPMEAIQIGSASVAKFRWHGPKGDFRPPDRRRA